MWIRAVLLAVTFSSCAGLLVRPMRVPVIGSPSLTHESLQVTTADGIALDGWLFRPAEQSRGLVVLLHGKDINRQHFVGAAERFVRQGFAVVAYDQRAHGASTGEFVTYGANEVGDLRSVIDEALKRVGRDQPVAVVGESLGAAVAIQTAAVEPRIKVVVAAASFADLETIVDDAALPADIKSDARREAERDARFSISDISPAKAAANIEVPTLVMHGSEDTFIPMKHALKIYEALHAPKKFVRLEGVDHVGVLLSNEAWNQVDRFLADSNFGATSSSLAASK
ncbi:MAG: alpha/beta hydrolase [Archangium sp.]